MKKSNWILFILLIAMSLAWGLYYWFFIVPSKQSPEKNFRVSQIEDQVLVYKLMLYTYIIITV